MRIKHRALTQECFCRHPVWAWVDDVYDETLVMPIAVEHLELPHDSGSLFVKAGFAASTGIALEGHVILDEDVDVVGIWRGTRFATFNKYQSGFQLMRDWQSELEKEIGGCLFPIKFSTDYTWYGVPLIGSFDLD